MLLGLAVGLVVVGVILSNMFFSLYADLIYPGIEISSVAVGGLTKQAAAAKLQNQLPAPESKLITVQASTEDKVATVAAQLTIVPQVDQAVEQAFQVGRDDNYWQNVQTVVNLGISTHNIPLKHQFDPAQLEQLIDELSLQIDQVSAVATAKLYYSNSPRSLTITNGQVGLVIDRDATSKTIQSLNQSPSSDQAVATLVPTGQALDEGQLAQAKDRANRFVGQTITATHPAGRFILSDQDLVTLLSFPTGFNQSKLTEVVETWSTIVNRTPQNAQLILNESEQVQEFVPDKPGLKVEHDSALSALTTTLNQIDTAETDAETDSLSFDLPTTTTPATTTLEQTNNLGVVERIGLGESNYSHSIPNRIHNVGLTATKISNTLIAPGESFSFNQSLGEVSSRTGFKSAYVISGGRTVLGDGGGVCQVSSTLFRALLDAGVKITKRFPHSYRVSYYEQNSEPGFDATVYSGDIDLRFVNDTPGHILIHATADPEIQYLRVELYGTSDGRTTEIKNYRKWDARGPLPTEYYPDPSLPHGVTKQIDWAAGGIKAEFTNVIKDKDGHVVREDNYHSNYRPWSAKFLRGV